MTAVCGFCRGLPVIDAESWLDGVPRPPAPCPRCGESPEPDNDDGGEGERDA